jgi:uncharacterized protein YbcC (UPF0753/DUF2309 family)
MDINVGSGTSRKIPEDSRTEAIRHRLQAAVDHLDHVLPGQAPILNFVHHNTLHGFQHLPFAQGLDAAEKLTGIHGYQSEDEFRRFHAQGRINDNDLAVAFDRMYGHLSCHPISIGERAIDCLEVYRIALLFGIHSITPNQFNWQMEEMDVLHRFQADVPAPVKSELLRGGITERQAVRGLWNACLDVFGLENYQLHPEELTAIPLEKVAEMLAEFDARTHDGTVCAINPGVHQLMCAESKATLAAMLESVGTDLSLRTLLLQLTGVDLLEQVRPVLIRFCASHLDEGLAALHSPDRSLGLYAAWKRAASADVASSLTELTGWRAELSELPEESVDAVIGLMRGLDIPESCWESYLERIALELPGWSGIINWRVQHPNYAANRECPVSLMDYLAIRLFLDSVWIERICRETWGHGGRLDAINDYFQRHPSEFLARRMLFANELPEWLANAVQKLIGLSWTERSHREKWQALADMIWTWKHSQSAEQSEIHTVYRSVWRLFRLCQHLGLDADSLRGLPLAEAERLLGWVDDLKPSEKGQLWLIAYENHYRHELFAALSQNHGRGRWLVRHTRPQAQVIFCMDDREESIRRHLEELNPDIETLGAAGFFGVPINWYGLDDSQPTPLCPVVVTPSHDVREQPQTGQDALRTRHDRGRSWKDKMTRLVNQEVRRNLTVSSALIYLLAPGALAVLAGKLFFPRHFEALKSHAKQIFVPLVPTRLQLTAVEDGTTATPDKPRLGLTIAEQADRVAAFLRNVGLTSNFAPLVVLSGHGSTSQNNPHLAAYDCGACSGRHGGPNARVFAAMANNAEVRDCLLERNIQIPKDTWFIGTEHNTCDETFTWYDFDGIPRHFLDALASLRTDLGRALQLSAHERCRRFASAPRKPSLIKALNHVVGRSVDFSQARPELGHATNAAALIGRRAVTRGVFFDRRIFLISYDASQDPDGQILEGILLAVGPVGAGINLEYYFSTVNNDKYGCGSKVPHNVAGLFGVMEGASSDLRTGLPKQMIEIHEAMRLQVVVEADTDVLNAIYHRQPSLRELIGNGWLLLSSLHPETGAIAYFEPERGFVEWAFETNELPLVERSRDWYDGHIEPRPPALIRLPDAKEGSRNAA